MNKNSFYTVDGIQFQSKIQAALFSTKVKKPITWNFNKEFFSSYDWTIEPELTLDQLYDNRAKNLREKYDYLILSYSGGADSHNILMSFIRQGLYIDEIIVNHMSTAWNNDIIVDPRQTASWNTGAEHQLQTLPRLKEIEHLIPKTKISILDMTDNLFKAFTSYDDASWILDRTEKLNPLNVTRYNYGYFTEVRKQFDRSQKIAMIVGIDKPKTVIKDTKFYIYFDDRSVNVVPIDNNFTDYTNSTLEFFYWSLDAVDILCKQAHVLKRFVESKADLTNLWQRANMNAKNWRTIQEPMIKSIIYSTWNSNWFQTEKSVSDWYNEFDSWFINGYTGHRSHTIWKEGIEYMIANASDHLKYNQGRPDGLKTYFQHYYIGTVNSVSV